MNFVIEEIDGLFYAWFADKLNLCTYYSYGVYGEGKTPQEAITGLLSIINKIEITNEKTQSTSETI